MKKDIVIDIHHVTKKYTLHHQKPTFSEQILKGFHSEQFTALNDLSLEIERGEKIGIIGKNGSGKTTLLKVIAGISTPTTGSVKTKGRIVSLIDLEAGFHPDLTGEENIYLNGLIIGMTKKEIIAQFSDIVEFAGIGKFIDTPLYTYSQGMKLRLGFAIAIHANPDTLILDEGISAGDDNFQKKLSQRIKSLFKQKKTIIVVSHWLEFLEENCNKIIWVDSGKIKKIGGVEVIKKYRAS